MQKDKTVVGTPICFAHPDGAVKNFMSKSTSSCFDHAAHVDACYVFESLSSMPAKRITRNEQVCEQNCVFDIPKCLSGHLFVS